jgi:hypothetical protein
VDSSAGITVALQSNPALANANYVPIDSTVALSLQAQQFAAREPTTTPHPARGAGVTMPGLLRNSEPICG